MMAEYRRQNKAKSRIKNRDRKHVLNLSHPYSFRGKSRKQKGGFLSRYDFAYAGRDSVNQAAYHVKKIAPELINQTMNRVDEPASELVRTAGRELDIIAARRINLIAHRSGETIQRIAPGIIRGAIEELYKTPFRLLGAFGCKKYNQMKQRVVRRLKKM